MTPARAAVALAALVAALPALAYQRTCDATTGKCVSWPTPEVTWRLNPDRPHTSPSCTADAVDAAARASFAAWQGAARDGAVCTSLRLPFGGTSSSHDIGLGTTGEHVVVFRQGWCSGHVPAGDPCTGRGDCNDVYNCFEDSGEFTKNTLALTTVLYEKSTGRIVDADVELADWGGAAGALASVPTGSSGPTDGWYFTCLEPAGKPICTTYGQPDCAYIDLQNTLTHEAGHFIGLAHDCGSDVGITCTPAFASVTMYPNAPPGETQKRTLSPDDVAGVCDIYPAYEPGPLVAGTSLQPTRGGCGTGGTGILAALLALAAGLRLRRR
jgi:uncharacterized protein (TIGR03382 family)